MYSLLLVPMDGAPFTKMINALEKESRVALDRAASGADALAALKDKPADLVVAAEQLGDMSGLEFAGKLVALNPMVNCALVSALDDSDFHEASEGLGILVQLPPDPDESGAAELLQKLDKIKGFEA